MKIVVIMLWVLVVATGSARSDINTDIESVIRYKTDPASVGEWSKPTNGLQGRLLYGESEKLYGTRRGLIYLELQNVSLSDNLYVYYDAAHSPFRCELVDSAGKTNEDRSGSYDGPIPSARWLS